MRNLQVNITERGFYRLDFDDRYGARCSIQKSSLATEDAIWLGINKVPAGQTEMPARMHLTRDDVRNLLPFLQVFVQTGDLPSVGEVSGQ